MTTQNYFKPWRGQTFNIATPQQMPSSRPVETRTIAANPCCGAPLAMIGFDHSVLERRRYYFHDHPSYLA